MSRSTATEQSHDLVMVDRLACFLESAPTALYLGSIRIIVQRLIEQPARQLGGSNATLPGGAFQPLPLVFVDLDLKQVLTHSPLREKAAYNPSIAFSRSASFGAAAWGSLSK